MMMPPCARVALCVLFVSLWLQGDSELRGQEGPPPAPVLNVASTSDGPGAPVTITREVVRHPHYHPHPHPTTEDASRFTTNRPRPRAPELPVEDDAFVFGVFGDRTGGPAEGVAVLREAVRDMNLFEPDLVMTVGDLIQGYNETPAWLAECREYKSVMDQLLCPWFPVAGNHDIYYRGPNPPEGEHEANYEVHFGPLWYAFEHKGCWFIVLFSDEGDPATGKKSIQNPESQKMSPEQFAWLKQTLKQASDAEHVFLFLHHPRWLGRNYGDDWEKVHEALVEAGNVRAVFAGHIHRMRYDGPRDGIEYVTLATVGGGQSGIAPEAGFLHHYHLITVRKQQIAMACLPVGNVMDVREITGTVSEEVRLLSQSPPTFVDRPTLDESGNPDGPVMVEMFNPTSQVVEFHVEMDSEDPRWLGAPSHFHTKVHPGQRKRERLNLRRLDGTVDASYRAPELLVNVDYLTEHARYALDPRRVSIPVRLTLPRLADNAPNQAVMIDAGNCLAVDSEAFTLPDGPITLEAWFRARSFGDRVGLVTKTEDSEYGLFVSHGVPYFTVHLGGRYVESETDEPLLVTNQWHHLAGVYDGREVRTYLDGKLVTRQPGSGSRRTNGLPLMLGADVTGQGSGTSFFDGDLDTVRLSQTARYSGDTFVPHRRWVRDDDTVLLFQFDQEIGVLSPDQSANAAHAHAVGDPRLIPLN